MKMEYREVHAHGLREIERKRKKKAEQWVELEGGTCSWVIVFCFLRCAVGVKVKRED